MHVKTGDKVKIIAGKDRHLGPAEVLRVLPSENRVVVEGRNLVKKHIKGNPMMGTESRIEEVEAPIHASNVLLFSEELERGVRTQVRFAGADGELFKNKADAVESFDGEAPERIRKVRYCVKTEEIFD
jgi:large subunit ribosomal protein L24